MGSNYWLYSDIVSLRASGLEHFF